MADWFCGFALLAGLFCAPAETMLSAYIEGEAVYVAPLEIVRIATLEVGRGDQVKAGDVLASMDADDARFTLDGARARHAESVARFENLTTGKRSEEIAVIEANRAAAKADLAQANLDLERTTDLVQRKVQSQSALDQARTAHDVARAHLREIDANLQVAGIAARVQEIEAARRVVEAAAAAVGDAEWRLEQRTLRAPADGRIEDIIRYAGEMAGPSAPVLSLLTPRNRKLKLFVPESMSSRVRIGDVLGLACDGCASALQAKVNFIASGPEFTPPVIYSVQSRQKLVVLVEGELLGDARNLAPGQIVDITFGTGQQP
ncbi:MAG: HlyD family efflux transporter periplasmic adaptor subunit [Pseudomonadales bacterium]|nr:HlyD family efflux transporter periplasmic adaptor subunit [Pseudomonadales bacterium]